MIIIVYQDQKNDNNGRSTKKARHNEKEAMKVKVDVYPASLQSLVVSNITALLDGHDMPESVLPFGCLTCVCMRYPNK